MLNSQPMGFYPPSELIQDAKRHGVQVLPADVSHSDWDCTLVEARHGSVRLGLCLVGSLNAAAGARVVEPLVTKCELLLDGTNDVFCRCLQDYPELPNPIYRALHDYARKVTAAG